MGLPRENSRRYLSMEVVADKSYLIIERIKEVRTMKEERLLRKLKKAGIPWIERDGKIYLYQIGMNIYALNRIVKPISLTRPWGFPAKFFGWRGFLKYYEENKVR